MGGEQRADLRAQRLAADGVGEADERVRAHPGAVDEGADHRLARQRRAPEDARVHHAPG